MNWDRRPEAPPIGPCILRGDAYLRLGDGAKAAAEYQKILDRRGIDPTNLLYPLARLGSGRAYALQGDKAKAKEAYQDFFAMWKDADPDVPILKASQSRIRQTAVALCGRERPARAAEQPTARATNLGGIDHPGAESKRNCGYCHTWHERDARAYIDLI